MNSTEQNPIKSDISGENLKLIELYAHGKLLISGEYLVLDGAKALAAPVKFGQRFQASQVAVNNNRIHWQAFDYQQKLWLNLIIDKDKLRPENENESKQSRILVNLLDSCRKLNPDFLRSENDVLVNSTLEFPNSWGLGSSSTLVYFLAQWAEIDPYELQFNTMKGSGYDIACAGSDSSLFYQLQNNTPIVELTRFNPAFKKQLHFVHLNKKQDSRVAINAYDDSKTGRLPIDEISEVSEQMARTHDLDLFENLIEIHEGIISTCLSTSTTKQRLFPDYNGAVKSLGAWGGDFIMVSRNTELEEFHKYFNDKGYYTILSFDEMIL